MIRAFPFGLEPKAKVLSVDCPCEFLYVSGGSLSTFVHGHVPDIWVYQGKTQLPLRLRQSLKPVTTIIRG